MLLALYVGAQTLWADLRGKVRKANRTTTDLHAWVPPGPRGQYSELEQGIRPLELDAVSTML